MLCHVFWSQVEYKIVCFIFKSLWILLIAFRKITRKKSSSLLDKLETENFYELKVALDHAVSTTHGAK